MIGEPWVSRDEQIKATMFTNKFTAETAAFVLRAAHTHLCPGKTYAMTSAPPLAPTTITLEPTGPKTEIGQGTYEVGPDVVAGKYRTTGGSACYWARLKKNDGATGDIIDNHFGPGQQVITIKAGEYFETTGCGPWKKS